MSSNAEPQSSSPVAALRVLIAEDNVTNQKLALAILHKQGHVAVVADDGRKAVEFYQRERFDLILMDMQMPEMDGLEATIAIRQLETVSGRRTPIVALTANAMTTDRERCLNAGMDHYISKPLRPADLVETVQRLTSSNVMNPDQNPNQPPQPASNVDIFDYAASVSQVGDDPELLGQLASVFLEQLPSLLPPLAQAVAASDAPAIRKSAHSLSSSVSVLVAPRAKNVARKLELMGLNSELATVPQTHAELLSEFDTLRQTLQSTPELKAA